VLALRARQGDDGRMPARSDHSGRAHAALMKLDAALRKADHEDYRRVAWKKVKAAEVAKAEKRLRGKLPPSYVELVTTHGLFVISGDDTDKYEAVESQYNRLLAPVEIAQLTEDMRRHFTEEEDEDNSKFLADAIPFQGNLYDDNFYVFRVSSRRKQDGEMTVGEWYHDEDSRWPRSFTSFEQHIERLCKNWLSELR
jgi:hypothetical protein